MLSGGLIRRRTGVVLCGVAVIIAVSARSAPAAGPDPGTDTVPTATPDAVWDRVADCESDGDWTADTGNGYYGGLQIWPPTWREAGGSRYASRPDRASRRQQITVAQEILREQGWQAWASCARELGLLGGPGPGSGVGPEEEPESGDEVGVEVARRGG
ncbi:hypothetical protein GCM10009665_23350 [Kitasatospora nipponensis]|uniref:Resuscitation-promoting factor core lysozyme-like domain-containing protein n=1 Tax=Kitasatospora nipponensis TaxID=258049 RepID=A0ABN1W7M6_9ACTN